MGSSLGEKEFDEALDNTLELARRCRFQMDFGH